MRGILSIIFVVSLLFSEGILLESANFESDGEEIEEGITNSSILGERKVNSGGDRVILAGGNKSVLYGNLKERIQYEI